MNRRLASWIDRLTPSCEKVAELSSQRLDRPLTPKERMHLRMHFLICYFCRRYHDQLARIHKELRCGGETLGQANPKCLCAGDKDRLKEACKKQAAL